MPRTCKSQPLHTVRERARLASREAPYWAAVRPGLRVGWRRKPGAACGTWLARLALPGNRILEKVLGTADDGDLKADADRVLNWRQAVDRAAAWAAAAPAEADRRRAAGADAPRTIRAALETYRQAKLDAGQQTRASEVATVLRRHLPEEIGQAEISALAAPNLLWVRSFATVEELRVALLEFRETYNTTWLIEQHGFRSPAAIRNEQLQPAALAA